MNAYELADELDGWNDDWLSDKNEKDVFKEHANMLRQQADRIAELEKQATFDAKFIERLRKKIYTPQTNAEPVAWAYDNGKWDVCVDGYAVWLDSSDFTHDASLQVAGDFVDLPQKFAYGNEIAKRLNNSLYTTPQTKPLSDEEITQIALRIGLIVEEQLTEDYAHDYVAEQIEFARAIEERHRIK